MLYYWYILTEQEFFLMRIAYIRVSTKEQNVARQLEAMKDHNIDRFYEDKLSGKDTNREQLQAMLDFAREGDTIYVESFSRLARNMLDLLTIIDQLSNKGIGFISLKENIDTTTPTGRLQLNVFGAIYQFERECSRERQREGIDIALASGKPYGRPKLEITDKFMEVYKKWKLKEITAVVAMNMAGCSKGTWYNKVNEIES